MLKRAVIVPALAYVACSAVFVAMRLTGAEERHTGVFVALIAVMNSMACFAVGNASRPIRHGVRGEDTRRRWKWNGVLVGSGLLIGGGAILTWLELHRGRMPVYYPVIVLGTGLLSVGTFFSIADGIVLLTARAKSVQIRMVLMGLVCAAICLLFPYWLRFDRDNLFGLIMYFVIAAIIVVALSGTISERITSRLTRTVEVMNEVTRGNLDVQLSAEGRDELAQVAQAFNAMTQGLRDREFLERAFGRYVAPSVLAALKESRALEMKPERREASVLFADIRGFTSFSEANSPEHVLQILNIYLERVVGIVAEHQGYLNKFIGDAVMVVFNAPLAQADHAARAISCARAMQEAVRELNAREAFGPGVRVEIGIGVNSGMLVAGNVGGRDRAEYSVIGDTVNTASRLCSNAKAGEVLVGGSTASSAGHQGLEAVPPLSVKGKAQPLEVFRLAA